MNIRLTVPEGSTTHGTPYLLCKPPEWYGYIVFFFANYVAHAATVVSLPGQGFNETFLTSIAALLVPSTRIVRAIDVFFQHPIFRK
jgi:aspartate/methionine/tyrosine aminotransferase